ncbi:MAG: alpha/beta fold hydrolase [Alphaproteobacteria bacterium]|nr:alpha/beta fold hydrolase [Alphaproteobacteria bacterium]
MFKLLFKFCLALVLGLLAWAAPARADSFYAATPAQAALPSGTLIKAQGLALPALYRAKAWRILYATRDYAGRPLLSSGIVIASTVHAATGRPQQIVAWAHPTVGTDPKCAPSLRQSPLQSILGVKDLIASGKIIVATDYPGLGTQGPVGYLIGKGEAYAVLDSVRAAARLPGLKVSRDYAVYGFSQGGHAALFAAREAASYMPEFSLKGAAAIAPPTDLTRLFAANVGSIEGKILLSYTLQSWAIKYGLSMREVLSDSAIATAWAINKTCVDDVGGSLEAFKLQNEFRADMFAANPLRHPQWRQQMGINSIAEWPTAAPLLVVQGGADSVVRAEVTQSALSASCLKGVNVQFTMLDHQSHSGSAHAAFPAVTHWLDARLSGKPNANSCTSALVARINDGSRR